jgi:hypothetical protein
MNVCKDKVTTSESINLHWTTEPRLTLVSQLLDRLCPSHECSDVDRAILGASLGG